MQNDNQLPVHQHLDDERLAALDHEAPTTDELAHLAACASCRLERQAYFALKSAADDVARDMRVDAPRLTSWEALSVALREDGLIGKRRETGDGEKGDWRYEDVKTEEGKTEDVISALGDAPVVAMQPLRRASSMWMRIAAAVLLTAGGALAGRWSVAGVRVQPVGSALASNTAPSPSGNIEGFGSVQQASEVLYSAQRDYERASLWLAANDSTVHSSDVYRARLAALDQMMSASRAALREAPQDPLLNHYFLSAYTAREATLQALGGTLPVDKTLERY